jgi:hypothetical protein
VRRPGPVHPIELAIDQRPFASYSHMPLALAAGTELEKANVKQVRDGLIAGGHASAEEIDAHLAALERGQLDVTTPPLISAWGRRA